MKEVYVIVPAFNEEQRIAGTLEKLKPYNYTVVVVDDGSKDKTAEVAKQNGCVVLKHFINRGQGAALDTGMQYAVKKGAKYIVHFDADGQFQAEEISEMLEPLVKDPSLDIVLGTRYGGKKLNVPKFKTYFIHKPALLFQNLTTGLKLTDVHSGFRAMTTGTAKRLKIQQDGMAHASEIVNQVASLKLKYTEVPITVVYNEFGQGLSGGFKILRSLLIRKILK